MSTDDIRKLNHRLARSIRTLVNQKEASTISPKQTLIALLGLDRLSKACGREVFDVAPIRERAIRERNWVGNIEDLGLLTWFVAVCCPDRLNVILNEFDFENALADSEDAREARTIGLAWFLMGIAKASLASPKAAEYLTDVAAAAYHRLQDNQGGEGIFAHAGAAPFPRAVALGRLGTFADQVWSIYALSTFARVFDVDEPFESALACGNAICALQGEQGQWWALYDKRTGRNVGHYPVVSLSMLAAAQCALQSLTETTGRDFDGATSRAFPSIARTIDSRPGHGDICPKVCPSLTAEDSWLARCRTIGLRLLLAQLDGSDLAGTQIGIGAEDFGWLLYAYGGFGLPTTAAASAT